MPADQWFRLRYWRRGGTSIAAVKGRRPLFGKGATIDLTMPHLSRKRQAGVRRVTPFDGESWWAVLLRLEDEVFGGRAASWVEGLASEVYAAMVLAADGQQKVDASR